MNFGWDEGKRLWLLDDRSIDFEDMKQLFDGRPRMTYPSDRHGEARLVSVGEIENKMFAVVWMWRDEGIWMITSRRAWKDEERRYRELLRKDRG